jgi:hypothetical protein
MVRTHDQACVFVVGTPRSGTTVATQLLAHGLDAGWVDNIAARFPRNPVPVIEASRTAVPFAERSTRYDSTRGRTHGLDPHEFAWYWREVLGLGMRHGQAEQVCWPDRKRLASTISAITTAVGGVWVAKAVYAAHYADDLDDLAAAGQIPPVHWIIVSRDRAATVRSIERARRDDGRIGWWGHVMPGAPQTLHRLPIDKQAVAQYEFNAAFYRWFDARSVYRTTYEQMCADPAGWVGAIARHTGVPPRHPRPAPLSAPPTAQKTP